MTVTALTVLQLEPALVSSMELCVIKSSCFARKLLIVVKCGCPNHSLSYRKVFHLLNFFFLIAFYCLFFQVYMYKTKGNSPSLHRRRFRSDIRGNCFIKRVVKHWKRLAREVVGSPSLEICKRCVDVALQDMF